MRRAGSLLLAAAALLALPSGASAAVRIGPDLSVKPPGPVAAVGCQPQYEFCSYVNLRSTNAGVPFAAPFSGVITKWGFRAGCCNDPHTQAVKMTLKTFRPGTQDGQFGYAFIVPVNEGPSFEVPVGNQLPSDPHTELPARMKIAAGERIGIDAPPQFSFAVYDGTPNVTSTVVFPGTVYNGEAYGNAMGNLALAISATVEPDADGDGYGDESQDCDPADPVQTPGCKRPTPPPPPTPVQPLPVFQPGGGCQGPCGGGAVFAGPIPPPPPSGDGSRMYVPIACPAGSPKPCGGFLIAQLGTTATGGTASKRLLVGRSRYSVAAGTTKKVRLKVTRAARKLFRAKRRRTVIFTLKPDEGPVVVVKRKVTFPKPKPKPRSRR